MNSDAFWDGVGRNWSWGVLIAGFLLVASWETARPRALALLPVAPRWLSNFGLYAASAALQVAILGGGVAAGAAWAQNWRWAAWQAGYLPAAIRFALGIAALDFWEFAIHWLAHHNEALWRFHEAHHSDPDFDASTGVRFHPVESLLRAAGAFAVAATGVVPLSAAVVYSLAVNAFTYLQHANASVPSGVDRAIRTIFLSTNAHRNHHSLDRRLYQSNYGVLLSIWDRMFGTWTEPEDVVEYGVREVAPGQSWRFWFLLARPFRTKRARSPLAAASGAVAD